MCQEETPDVEAQELVNSMKLRQVPRLNLNDWPDEERGCKELQSETKTRRKNMRDTLKDARINDCRSEMRKVEGILQRSPFEKSLQAAGQNGGENPQTTRR